MEKLIDLVNTKLASYVNEINNNLLKEMIDYALFPGGKRLRPLILLCILNDKELDLELGINQAIAIEMIHNYSLIHDDLPSRSEEHTSELQSRPHLVCRLLLEKKKKKIKNKKKKKKNKKNKVNKRCKKNHIMKDK